jgi:hypothetical protein
VVVTLFLPKGVIGTIGQWQERRQARKVRLAEAGSADVSSALPR